METQGKGLGEELVAVDYLLGGVDVEGRAVLSGEGGEVGSVAVEDAVAVGERGGGCVGNEGV